VCLKAIYLYICVYNVENQNMNTFNTTNPNHYSYTTEVLEFHILGGISIAGLDRMRVTLKIHKVDSPFHALRHTIDLYNANALEKFVRKIAEFLEVGTSIIRRALQELIHKLETYRLELLEIENSDEVFEYELSQNERRQAMTILRSDKLMEKTNKLIGASGVIGETDNRLLMYLIFTSRKMQNPLHCISFGSSGVGKTHLQSKVASLIPDEDKVEMTVLSANAFYYYKRNELKHKLILIEDMDGAEEVLYPLRELQTKKRITKSVVQKGTGGEGTTKSLTVEGPICVAGCTTQESIYEDNSNRSFLLYIDESEDQDERIMSYQRRASAGKVNYDDQSEAQKILQNVQRLLKPVRIINPYAEHLILPKSVFKPRRSNAHYLQFIEAVTFYCQHQRESQFDVHTGEEYIETSLEDIKIANALIKDTLLRKSDSLNGATRNYLENLKTHLSKKQNTVFTNQEIRRELRIKESTLRRYHQLLVQEGYIKRRTDIQKESFCYEIVDVDEFTNLEKTIDMALNMCIEKLQKEAKV
jgi:predicted transcriptional regulator